MKPFFLSLGLAVLSGVSFASPVTTTKAEAVATHFISRQMGNNVTLQLQKTYTAANGQTSIYVFDVNNGTGFVVVAGDDIIKPILGYSSHNRFPADVSNNEVAYWMNGYNQQIGDAITNGVTATPETAAQWAAWNEEVNGAVAAKPTDVQPLLTTEWDQMGYYGNYIYNNLCPVNTPTGCVATAMAQIMNFWQSPATGTGSHSYNSSPVGGTLSANFGATTYDWNNMPDYLTSNSPTVQKNAIATLMFHCGVSVNMNYNTAANGGSGAQVINFGYSTLACSQNALPGYFGYKTTIRGNQRVNYSDTQWINMLKFEIDNGRPVLYAGFGTLGGHAFDFDGYDDNNLFHINWGWSGESNGYFTVDNLAPPVLGAGGGGGNFNDGQQALIMIEPANSTLPVNPNTPDYPWSFASVAQNTNLSQSEDTIIFKASYTVASQVKNLGTEKFDNGYLSIMAVDVTDSTHTVLLNQRRATINANATFDYSYTTTNNASLVAGRYNIVYRYAVDGGQGTPVLWRPVPDGAGVNHAVLTVTNESVTGIAAVAADASLFRVYPNPSADAVTLDWKGFNGSVTSVAVFSLTGAKVAQVAVNGASVRIPVSQLSTGTYMAQIITDKGVLTKEIVVRK